MPQLGTILMLCGLGVTVLVALPMRYRLSRRLGERDFHGKLKQARADGDPGAKKLYVAGALAMTLYGLGGLLVIVGRSAA